MIITISGLPGSGKSILARHISKVFNLEYICIGSIFKEIAKKENISIAHLNQLAKKDVSIDKNLDQKQIELKNNDNLVLDSRLSAFFIQKADIKIFVKANLKTRAQRISQRDNISFEQALKDTIIRDKAESRYKKLYAIDFRKLDYNIIFNTDKLTIEQAKTKIIEKINEFLKPKLKVYIKENDVYADMLKNLLKSHNLEFESIDVSKNKKVRLSIFRRTKQKNTPIIEYNNRFFIGFDREKIKDFLLLK